MEARCKLAVVATFKVNVFINACRDPLKAWPMWADYMLKEISMPDSYLNLNRWEYAINSGEKITDVWNQVSRTQVELI
jgi:hypothetical protein